MACAQLFAGLSEKLTGILGQNSKCPERVTMKDLRATLERILTEAEDCELIGKLATDPKKRDLFKKLAVDLRAMAKISKP
jgi:hypothetical protein